MNKNKIQNHGFNIQKEIAEQSTQDWVFGVGEQIRGLAENIDFIKYLPVGEVQKGVEDTMDCTTRSLVNILETKFTYLYHNKLLSKENLKWLEDKGYVVDGRVVF